MAAAGARAAFRSGNRTLRAGRAATLERGRFPGFRCAGTAPADRHERRNRSADVAIPRDALAVSSGVSGSGKPSLAGQALAELAGAHLGHEPEPADDGAPELVVPTRGRLHAGAGDPPPGARRPEADRPHAVSARLSPSWRRLQPSWRAGDPR
jgi:hypothetical protein